MDRINTATKAVDLHGAGKHGWKNSNATLGTPPTDFNAEWTNGVQEELLNIIEAVGLVPAIATLTQVRQAVKRMAGANLRTITVVGPTALTADDAGVVLIDATADNVTVTLPAANAVAGVPLSFEFVRLDATANTVTVNRAGADTFVGGATSFTLTERGAQRTVAADAVSKWATIASSNTGSLLAGNGYQRLPSGLIVQWGTSGSIAQGTSGSITFPIAFPVECVGVYPTIYAQVSGTTNAWSFGSSNFLTSGATLWNNGGNGPATAVWFAIGY
jgi:hypothetical protein